MRSLTFGTLTILTLLSVPTMASAQSASLFVGGSGSAAYNVELDGGEFAPVGTLSVGGMLLADKDFGFTMSGTGSAVPGLGKGRSVAFVGGIQMLLQTNKGDLTFGTELNERDAFLVRMGLGTNLGLVSDYHFLPRVGIWAGLGQTEDKHLYAGLGVQGTFEWHALFHSFKKQAHPNPPIRAAHNHF